MTRRLCAIVVVALILVATGSSPMRAEEPSQRWCGWGLSDRYRRPRLRFTPFWERLRELGWVEGQNLVVETRSADGHLERLPALMADVIDRKVDVLVTYGMPGAIAARKATSTVPIVAWALSDPVRAGLAASLARPGGNLTGLSMGYAEGVAGKLLEILQDAVPRLSTVAVIVNLNNPMPRDLATDLETLAPARNLKLHIIELRGPEAIGRAFERARQKAQAVVVIGEPITLEHRAQVIALAAKHRLPAIYLDGSYVKRGWPDVLRARLRGHVAARSGVRRQDTPRRQAC